MNIGIVSRVVYPLHGFGGMEKHVYYLAVGLAERGHEVELFCMETDVEVPEELQHENISFTFVPYREFSIGRLSYLSFIKNLFPYFSDLNEKDVVHFQGMTGGVPYAFRGKRPKVYTTHGLEQFKHSLKWLLFPFNAMEVLAAQRADRIVSLGPGNTTEIKQFLRVGDEKITEIPNGVDVDLFEPKPENRFHDMKKAEFTVVVVSRLVDYKGFGELIQAVARLQDEIDIELIVVGDGPDHDRLEALAANAPVRFQGRVPEEDLPHYYALGDVFALPTHGEGMPLSILESFACGTPVLSTTVGSVPDIVDSDTGVLVEPKSVNGIMNGLRALKNQDLTHMGEVARRRAVDKFSWDRTVERTIDMYEELTV